MFVVFANKGEIDPRTIKTFGVSVKESENPIGFFGTGLKYSIAILIRMGMEVEISSGLNKYVFKPVQTNIRGKAFELICMNDEELPFTTELGKNWELWQAFRELYCNCLDENGYSETMSSTPEPQQGVTYVTVKGDKFLDLYYNKSSIVYDRPKELLINQENSQVEIYNQPSDYIYYRGIRVAKLDKSSKYTYNVLKSMTLTEDRTLLRFNDAEYAIASEIKKLTDKSIIKNILCAEIKWFEATMQFDHYFCNGTSKEYDEVLAKEYSYNNEKLNMSAKASHARKMKLSILKNFEFTDTTEIEEIQLQRCKEICKKLYYDFENYPIKIVKDLGETTMGLADEMDRRIILSKRCFHHGTKYLLSTIIEEYFHLKTGYKDHTRELQTYLFDSLCSMIENYVIQEPI